MDSNVIAFLVILTLVLVALRNGCETKRGTACIAVLWTTAPGYFIYPTDLYFTLVDALGSYGYQSATPLLAICALACIKDKLSTVLMSLFTVVIFANIYFFWLEGQGHQIQDIQQTFVWSVFVVEVALMLSPRLTNGIHRVVQGFIRPRNAATHGIAGISGIGGVESDASEAPK